MNNNNEKEINLKNNKLKLNEKESDNQIKDESCLYKCALHCVLNSNDCVNSIDIFNNHLVYGTIMGNISFCRIEEEKKDFKLNLYHRNIDYQNINNTNTNLSSKANDRYLNVLNKTESNISGNKDINVKDDNPKEIILNVNITSKYNKNDLKEKNIKENSEKDSAECIQILNHKEEDHQSTDNLSSENLELKINNDKFFYPAKIDLMKGAIENICCISLYNDILNFTIGDMQIIHCEKISKYYGNDISLAHNFKRTEIYDSEQTHNDYCENCYCLMSTNNFLILYSFYCDFNWPLRINSIKYQNRNLNTGELANGFINMSNYNVPFDFDGDHFLYLEYFDESSRSINIYKTLSFKYTFQYMIDKNFGHISHMKLLPDNSIFLCRNMCVCEIYKYKGEKDNNEDNDNDNFILLNIWVHNENKEIISSNVYILENKISFEYKRNNIPKKIEFFPGSQIKRKNKKNFENKHKLHNLINDMENNSSLDSFQSKNRILAYEKEYYNKYSNEILNLEYEEKDKKDEKEPQIERKANKKDSLKVNFNDSENNVIQNKEYYIITLDISGNFNLFYNNENRTIIKKTLFNLYKIENIPQIYKDLTFFSIGYPYYIIMNEFYYVITTDNGVYVIKRNK